GTAGADQGARRRDGGRAGEPNRGAASEELREADGRGAARGREADEACEPATAAATYASTGTIAVGSTGPAPHAATLVQNGRSSGGARVARTPPPSTQGGAAP